MVEKVMVTGEETSLPSPSALPGPVFSSLYPIIPLVFEFWHIWNIFSMVVSFSEDFLCAGVRYG